MTATHDQHDAVTDSGNGEAVAAPASAASRLEVAIVVLGTAIDGQGWVHEFWVSFDGEATGSSLFALLHERGIEADQTHRLVVERSERDIHCCTKLVESGLVNGDRLRLEHIDAPRTTRSGDPARAVLRLTTSDDDQSAHDAADDDTLVIGRESTLGRSGEPGVSYLESDGVSREHARLSVGPNGAEIADLGSLNGTYVNGTRVDRATRVIPGDRLRFGPQEVTLTLEGLPARSITGAHLSTEAGVVRFNRSPRTITPAPSPKLEPPTPPATPPKRRFPLLAALAPLGMGIVMALLLSPMYAIFTAMAPIMMLFTFIDDRRSGRKQFGVDTEKFRASLADFALKAADRNDQLGGFARASVPSVHLLRWWARSAAPALWHHRPQDLDFLTLAPADRDRPSLLELAPDDAGDPDLLAELHECLAELAPVVDVPVLVDLRADPVIGLCGPPDLAFDTARAMVAELTALVSPRFLKLAVIAPQHAPEWEWAKWLPHSMSNDGDHRLIAGNGAQASMLMEWLERLIAERREDAKQSVTGAQQSPLPHVLAVVQGPIEVSRRTLSTILDSAGRSGISVLFVGEHLHDLPAQTDVIVELSSSACDVTFTATGRRALGATPRRLTACDAIDYARDLAPFVDVTAASAQGDIPRAVSAGEMFTLDDLAIDSVQERWNSQTGSLGATVGTTADSTFDLDLRRDGPHALVAGTTGSGKSEFLQSLVASLALEHSPQRLNFILIDYKGGAAFSDCVQFPHTVGYVTNLDDRLAERALTSLRAELRRRERLLLAAGAKDLIALEREDPDAAPPALVIVIDEFAALKAEVPDFVDGLVDIAQRGRSMGVHMILATQKPSGVITAQIEANTNIRVALRVAGASESSEVLGVPDAADISNRTPGRALIKVGARKEDIVEMQSVYVGGHSLGDVSYPNVMDTLRYGMDGPQRPDAQIEATTKTDLEFVVAALNHAWTASPGSTLHRPWLPELGTVVPLAEITASPGASEARGRSNPAEIAVGLADLPEDQKQTRYVIDLEKAGNVAIYGAPGSGKTTLLRTVAASMANHSVPDEAVIYGLDCTTGGLRSLAPLPHVADIVDGRDIERVRLLLSVLDRTLDGRRTLMGRADAGSLSEWRERRPDDAPPLIVVMIDGFGQLWSALEELRLYQTTADLVRLIVDGRSVGIHFILTGDKRSALSSQVTSAVGLTLVQRMASDDDYSYLNLQGAIPADHVPGRTLLVEGGEFQAAICSDTDDTTAAAQTSYIEILGQQRGRTVSPTLLRLPALPERVTAGQLGLALALDALPVGFDEFLDEVTVNLDRSPLVLILGPSGSGRSSTLEMFGHQLRHVVPQRFAIACRRGSPLATSTAFTDVTTSDGAARLEQLAQLVETRCTSGWESPLLVAIDDADDYLDGPGSEELGSIVRRADEAGVIVLAAAHNFIAATSYSSWVRMMASVGNGIVLQPQGRDDTDAFGAAFPNMSPGAFPVGRGLVIAQRAATVAQLATADAADRRSEPPAATGGLSLYPETVRTSTMSTNQRIPE